MNEKDLLEKKREVLKKLALDEKDIVADLDYLTDLSIPFLKFDTNSGEIVILDDKNLNYEEKIFLLLLGKYFVFQIGMLENYNLSRQQIKDELRIPETTGISNQINNLLDERTIGRIERDNYIVNIFEIKEKLEELDQKYK